MKTEYEKKAVIKLPKDSNAFAIDTPDHLRNFTGYALLTAKGAVVKV